MSRPSRGLRDACGCVCRGGPRPCSRPASLPTGPPCRFYPAPYSITPGRVLAQSALSPYLPSPVTSYQVRSCPEEGSGFALPSCFRLDTDRCFFRCFLCTDCMQTVSRKSVARDHLPHVRAVVGAPFTPCPPSHSKAMLASCYFPPFLSFSYTYKYVVLEVIVYVIKFCHIKCLFTLFPHTPVTLQAWSLDLQYQRYLGVFSNRFLESTLDPEELWGMSPPSLRFNKHSRRFCAALF